MAAEQKQTKKRVLEEDTVCKIIGAISATSKKPRTRPPRSVPDTATKYFDVEITDPVITSPYGLYAYTAWAGAEPGTAFTGMTEITNIVQGSDFFNRIGNTIHIKSVQYKASFPLSGSGPTAKTFRYLLVYDKQCNGAFPTRSTILNSQGYGCRYHSMINSTYKDRFILLADKLVSLNNYALACYCVADYIKIDMPARYSGTAGTIADCVSGAIYFIAYGYTAGTAVQYIGMPQSEFKVTFIDQ